MTTRPSKPGSSTRILYAHSAINWAISWSWGTVGMASPTLRRLTNSVYSVYEVGAAKGSDVRQAADGIRHDRGRRRIRGLRAGQPALRGSGSQRAAAGGGRLGPPPLPAYPGGHDEDRQELRLALPGRA